MADETKATKAETKAAAPAKAAKPKVDLPVEVQVALLNQIAAGVPRGEAVEVQANRLATLYRAAVLLVTTGEAGE